MSKLPPVSWDVDVYWLFVIMKSYVKVNLKEIIIMDRRTRKFMAMNEEVYPRSDVTRVYVSRQNGGIGLIGCENSVKSEENGLGWHLEQVEL